MKLDYIPSDIRAEKKKLKQRTAATPQKETTMKKNTTTKAAPKQPKTVKVSTLLKAAAIIAAIVASYIMGAVSANTINAMIDTEAEARAEALLKTDGKQ